MAIDFSLNKGVRYHRTFGKHIVATLIIQDTPIIELSKDKEKSFFGHWDETVYDQGRHMGEAQKVTEGIAFAIIKL